MKTNIKSQLKIYVNVAKWTHSVQEMYGVIFVPLLCYTHCFERKTLNILCDQKIILHLKQKNTWNQNNFNSIDILSRLWSSFISVPVIMEDERGQI